MAGKEHSKIEDFETLQSEMLLEFGKRHFPNVTIPDSIINNINPEMKLRPYQKECFQFFTTYCENDFDVKEDQPHLLFHMATGSGKTLVMAGIILYMYAQGYRNFLFFVNSSNIIEKTKENFLNVASKKYLFAKSIEINGKKVEVRKVDNFQSVDKDSINLCLTTIQALHDSLNTPREGGITYDDFKDKKIILISDEAHHMNSATKKKIVVKNIPGTGDGLSDDWETTVMKIFKANESNCLYEFTATEDLYNEAIAEKYEHKVLFDYNLKQFRKDGYSKDIDVVQRDLEPMERAIQAIILNQYKRKLFEYIGLNIKPVILLKSKTIKENATFFKDFISSIKSLNIDLLEKIKSSAVNDVSSAFSFFEERGISYENLILELQEDFKEENLLLIDGKNISPQKQIYLNTLENKDNEFRAIFAVDMLNEGWDVLNLYDIVRLYNTRDGKDGKVGKTTMQEAQLIGRGARYMPFVVPSSYIEKTAPNNDTKELWKIAGKRKFDKDTSNRLRILEKLHYHSASNSRYISELKTALVLTGIMPEESREIHLKIKDSFKQTELYKQGYVLANERISYTLNDNNNNIGDDILQRIFKVRLYSGAMKTSIILDDNTNNFNVNENLDTKAFYLKDFGFNVIRAAVNRFNSFHYNNLVRELPSLSSINEFVSSDDYLAGVKLELTSTKEIFDNLTQKQKLNIVIEVLRQIEPMLKKNVICHRGSREFKPIGIFKDIFTDKTIKINIEGSEDKEYGKSIKETNLFDPIDLSKCEWYAFNDCFGTDEEKYFVKYFSTIVQKLKEKYEDVYLVRNECAMKIFSFKEGIDGGAVFEPDYLLFLKKKGETKEFTKYQIFIEPKGSHLKEHDAWKEKFLKEINENAIIEFATQNSTFHIIGLPFFLEEKKASFDNDFKSLLGVSSWE